MIRFSPKFWMKLVKQGLLKEALAMLRSSFIRGPVRRRLDWRSTEKTELMKYLEKQLESGLAEEVYLRHRDDLKELSDDDIVLYWQTWAMQNIKWTSDWDRFKTPENWEDMETALRYKQYNKYQMDCESGATLIYVLCRYSGIPEDVLVLWGGDVRVKKTAPSGGHVWLEYNRSLDGIPVKVDWCYLSDTRPMGVREHAGAIEHIVRRWWGFHELGYYMNHQGVARY